MSLAPVSAVCVPTTSALSVGSIMATTALDASGMARATAIPVPHAGDAHATVSSGPQTLPTDHAPMTTLMPAAPGSPSPVLTPGALPAPANMLPQIPRIMVESRRTGRRFKTGWNILKLSLNSQGGTTTTSWCISQRHSKVVQKPSTNRAHQPRGVATTHWWQS